MADSQCLYTDAETSPLDQHQMSQRGRCACSCFYTFFITISVSVTPVDRLQRQYDQFCEESVFIYPNKGKLLQTDRNYTILST